MGSSGISWTADVNSKNRSIWCGWETCSLQGVCLRTAWLPLWGICVQINHNRTIKEHNKPTVLTFCTVLGTFLTVVHYHLPNPPISCTEFVHPTGRQLLQKLWGSSLKKSLRYKLTVPHKHYNNWPKSITSISSSIVTVDLVLLLCTSIVTLRSPKTLHYLKWFD